MADELTWFCAYTNIRCEKRAQEGLREKGYQTCLPVEKRWKRHSRAKQVTELPLFTRYLFVGVDRENQPLYQYQIPQVDGIEDVLRNNGYWLTVPAGVVSRLRLAMIDGTFDHTKEPPKVPLPSAGDRVRIAEGPFKDFIGKVKRADSKRRIEVLLELFGDTHTITIGAGQVLAA